jgi:hypothetical protein
MSFSRNLTFFYVSVAVLIQRSIGRLLRGGKKNINIKAKLLPNYFAWKYLPVIENLSQREITVEIPETIWQFWDNPTGQITPEIVKASVQSVEKLKGDFEHKILDHSTIENYSDLPGFVFDRLKNKQMRYAHFADLLRLNLLKNHGGIWMDATCYMMDFIPEQITNSDFFVFLTGKQTRFPYSFIQNCFIRAKKGSFLNEAWYQICLEYWKNETKTIEYFQHQLMFKALIENNLKAKKIFAEMPHISEDETLLLVGKKLFKKFDEKEWERIKKASFFQKTAYLVKKNKIANPTNYPGTYFSNLCEGNLKYI